MFVCDDRCRECRKFDWDAQCCGYLYKHSEKVDDKSRGRVVRRRNGRRVMVYANPCDKFEPCDGTANAPGSINFESGPVKRKKERRAAALPHAQGLPGAERALPPRTHGRADGRTPGPQAHGYTELAE